MPSKSVVTQIAVAVTASVLATVILEAFFNRPRPIGSTTQPARAAWV